MKSNSKVLSCKVGEYTLLDSLNLIQFQNNPISLTIPDPSEKDMELDIVFKNDSNSSESYTELMPDTGTHATMTIFNTENGGNGQLLHLGTYGKEYGLFLNYWVTSTGTIRSILINLYIRK